MNVLQAMLCEKVSVYDQIVIINLKRRRDGYQTNFNTNFHLKDIYEWYSLFNKNEMMQQRLLTSLAFYELYITHKRGSRIIIDVRN